MRQAPLSIHEDSTHGIYVRGLSEFMGSFPGSAPRARGPPSIPPAGLHRPVRSRHDCLQLLRMGDDNRAIRHTHMNEFSSRSHAIFQLTVRDAPHRGVWALVMAHALAAPGGLARGRWSRSRTTAR